MVMLGALTISGRLFHCSTTLVKKLYLKASILGNGALNLKLCPLVIVEYADGKI